MSRSAKRVLMAVILVIALGCAFFAAYSIAMKKLPGEAEPSAAPVSGSETDDPSSPGAQQPAVTGPDGQTEPVGEGETQETVPQAETTSGATTADETAVTTAAPETTAPAAPQGAVSPTYINGILVVNKSYPLPKDYDPGGLTSECESAFYTMQEAAEEEGLDLYIASGFRSYDLQASLYQRYCNADGQAAADTYSARPGHSEHQSGLAIDLNSISSDFAYTAEGQWVAEHCWEYGFILRYPADKVSVTGYMYEPWHIRYVGRDTAAAIYQSGLCLEEYLGIDSVYNY